MISDSDSDSDFGFGEDDDITSTEEEETSPEEEDATRDKSVEQDNDEEAVAEERIKKKRRRFSLQDKMILLRQIRHRETQGLSQQQACKAMNIHEKQIIEWKRQWSKMRDTANKKAKSLCKGSNRKISMIFPLVSCCSCVNIPSSS